MNVSDKAMDRREVRLLQDEATSLKRRWTEIQKELQNMKPGVDRETLLSALKDLMERLERETRRLDGLLPH